MQGGTHPCDRTWPLNRAPTRKKNISDWGLWGRIITTMTSSTALHTFNFHYGLLVLVVLGPTGTLNIALVVVVVSLVVPSQDTGSATTVRHHQFSSNPNRENIEAE